jgi:sec-independent protein translocase protein TatA
MGAFSIWHWLILLLVVVLVFGTKKLKGLGGDLGGFIRDFKKTVSTDEPSARIEADPAVTPDTTTKTEAKDKV